MLFTRTLLSKPIVLAATVTLSSRGALAYNTRPIQELQRETKQAIREAWREGDLKNELSKPQFDALMEDVPDLFKTPEEMIKLQDPLLLPELGEDIDWQILDDIPKFTEVKSIGWGSLKDDVQRYRFTTANDAMEDLEGQLRDRLKQQDDNGDHLIGDRERDIVDAILKDNKDFGYEDVQFGGEVAKSDANTKFNVMDDLLKGKTEFSETELTYLQDHAEEVMNKNMDDLENVLVGKMKNAVTTGKLSKDHEHRFKEFLEQDTHYNASDFQFGGEELVQITEGTNAEMRYDLLEDLKQVFGNANRLTPLETPFSVDQIEYLNEQGSDLGSLFKDYCEQGLKDGLIDGSGSSNPTGIIVGCSVGALVLCVLCFGLYVYCSEKNGA